MRQAGTLLIALILAACALQESQVPVGFDKRFAKNLFYQAHRDISDIYIDETRVSELALSGLENLSKLDSDITVVENRGLIQLYSDGKVVGAYASPAAQDIKRWARLTANVLAGGRQHSKSLSSIDAEDLYQVVLDGITSELDHPSRYAGPKEFAETLESKSEAGGVGVSYRMVDDGVQILTVFRGGPAEKSGLKHGDVIVSIDGEPIAGLSQRAVLRHLRGAVGSEVRLSVRSEKQPIIQELSAVRTIIPPRTIEYRTIGNFSYIGIPYIPQNLSQRLRAEIESAQGAVEGIVLDLRGNAGGLLKASVGLADLFLADEPIATTHGRHPESHQLFYAKPNAVAAYVPIVVLIDGATGSGAEIVAAALQDSGRAVVVGSSSYGQGSVQTVLTLPNKGELILTWTRIFAPSLYEMEGRGVLPDICTTLGVETVEDVIAQLEAGRLPIDRAIQRQYIDPDDSKKVEALRDHCPPASGNREIDFNVAIRLLSNSQLYRIALGNSLGEQ